VVDSIHTVADVNTEKDEKRQRNGRPPRDGGARWGVKGNKVARKESLYFYSYAMLYRAISPL